MGKTHEALDRAQKEYQLKILETPNDPHKIMLPMVSRRIPMKAPSDRFHEVKTKLITRFSGESVKTIMFTSPVHGSGSSTIAANFATTLAQDCRLNVLLIDANLRSPRLHEIFNIEYNKGLSNLLTMEEEETSLFKKVGHGNLHVIPCGKNKIGPLNIFESMRFKKTIEMMRERFDYVILDAPPINSSAESRVIATRVDGVILVLESGKTRHQVAIKTKQEIEEAGAKVLGVILNRHKYYIPKWIYNRI